MCTAATYKTKDFYFGRTLDYEFSYGDEVTVTPRNYPFEFRVMGPMRRHYAMIGMAYVAGNVPLYYDAMNEKGLGMAGLNFVGNAHYEKRAAGKDNVAQFEFIPWVLGQCASVAEARTLLERINLIDEPFSEQLPLAQLHWLIADKDEAITVEAVREGIKIYDNPVGVMTNNPPFDQQMFALNNYMHLSPRQPENCWSVPLTAYSRGMGALGLPGDLSSQSRFVRGLHEDARGFRRFGDGERQPVLPHPRLGRSAARLLRRRRGQVRDHALHLLLQRAEGHLLLHDLREPPDHGGRHAQGRPRWQRAGALPAHHGRADPLAERLRKDKDKDTKRPFATAKGRFVCRRECARVTAYARIPL